MPKKIQFALLTLLAVLICSLPALAQTPFTKTYQLGGNIEVACCNGPMAYGFTPVIQMG